MDSKKILKKVLVELSRIIIGVTFTFSGFTKSVDPMGTTYKIQDYFTAFGFEAFNSLALPVAIALCVVEFSVGVFMLFGIYRKWTSRMALLIMIFMTPFTLYLAIFNPVSDCGCFGDAFVITNWQTFFKNIILLAAAIVLFFWHETITNLYTGKFYWLVAFYIIAFGIAFCVYNSNVEPVIDFRPYKIGANLPELISVEEGKGDVYENVFIYEKNGEKKEFSDDNYPWQDSTWIFVDRINKLVKEGEKPQITDFEINRLYFSPDRKEIEDEENITSEVLESSNYTFLMIAYSLSEMNETYLSRFEDVNNYAKEYHYDFYCLTASSTTEILEWDDENPVNFIFCQTDSRTLKTMIRSNPGLILLKNGVVINKWPDIRVPAEEQLSAPLDKLPLSQKIDTQEQNKNTMLVLLSIFFIPLLLLTSLDLLIFRKKQPPMENSKKTTDNINS
ncbi:DoxX family protein [Dysgonomonas sp. 216]|uniref:BT_3928 family protein n=1 Tax=Dysgonomonas sp. 216 TaxID=2302934 RepID=UPI0013D17788|nr:BT_3928 family protein [Dysgonomonas sp. 216]NDW19677.1 DoxX family protein [Dysgonomonas sp. 216]